MNHSWIILLLVSLSYGDRNENPSRLTRLLKRRLEKRFLFDDRHFFNADEMLLFPDVAFPVSNDPSQWKVMIHGWRYQPSKTKHLLEIAANNWIDQLADHVLNATEIRRLNDSVQQERLRPFFVQDNFNEVITIRIGNLTREIRTDEKGEFYEPIDLTAEQIQTLRREQNSDRILQYQAMGYDGRLFNGTIYLIESTGGVSIISDIDDTIKISNVLDKVRLLTNTFILPFEPVPGTFVSPSSIQLDLRFSLQVWRHCIEIGHRSFPIVHSTIYRRCQINCTL